MSTKTVEFTAAEQEILKAIESRSAKIEALEKQHEKTSSVILEITKTLAEVQKDFLEWRRLQLEQRALNIAPRKPGQVSAGCARHLGAFAVVAHLRQNTEVPADKRTRFEEVCKGILGVEIKAALTSSDIPLPTEWSGEVVELVSEFSASRQWGTVFPLGAGTVKLPRLGTDPTFGLIASSGSVTEKSPTVIFVTFTPEKFGGLIRLPSELDEDSIVAIGQFVARYAARQLAYVEDYQFFVSTGAGSGINGSVKGLVESTITNSKVVQMASTKTHYSDATLANLRALRAVVDAAALGMSAYYMHPTFEQHLSGLNTAGDKPYIANGIRGASLDGFPIRWVDAMPAYSTSANVSKVFALFGDVSYQYLGVRGGIRFDTSKEAGFTTDETLIRALERLTVGLMAVGAVGGLQTAAS